SSADFQGFQNTEASSLFLRRRGMPRLQVRYLAKKVHDRTAHFCDIYGPAPRCQGGLKRKNTCRNRCRHISDLIVKIAGIFGPLCNPRLPSSTQPRPQEPCRKTGFEKAGLTYRVITSSTPRIVQWDTATSWRPPLCYGCELLA